MDINPIELNERLTRGDDLVLLDVREAEELEVSRLPGVVHIPMQELTGRISELNPEQETVVICRTGNRSGRAAEYLRAIGFRQVRNMLGGMNAWADQVDPTSRKY